MGHGFVLRIPVVTFHTWIGNTLEGKGVEPDAIVGLSRGGLMTGLDSQLVKALQLTSPRRAAITGA